MKQIDRYVLQQLFGPFVFFVVIFGGILWLNQALRIVDVVISNGQSGLVFAELSTYLLPKVLETVVPVGAFAAAVFLTNRLYSESELVVLMGVGHSPAGALVPHFAFGMICFVLMSVLVHCVTPAALNTFQDRQHAISKEFLTQMVQPGEFSSPADGVTVFFGSTSADGRLGDVIVHDQRNDAITVTHTASTGQLVSDGDAPRLVLFDGSIQRYETESRRLNTIQFDSLSYDLGQFAKSVGQRRVSTREVSSMALLQADGSQELGGTVPVLEFHARMVKALLAIVVPALGAIVLISAGFSRSGFFLRIALAVVFMVSINSLRGLAHGQAEANGDAWIYLYIPVFVAFFAVFALVRSGLAPWKSGVGGLFQSARKLPPKGVT